MKKIFSIVFIAIMGLLITNSCDEKNDYNWDNYVPVISGSVVGPGDIAASGATYTYSVTYRGGSTFNWTVTGAGATVVTNDKYSSIAYITVPQSGTPDPALAISVVEVTAKGVSSVAKTKTVNVSPFCVFDVANFVGEYLCDEPGYAVYSVFFTQVDANTIISDNFWDSGWDVQYHFDGNLTQTMDIVPWTWTSGGGTRYDVSGSGTYDGCTGNFTVDYIVLRNGADYDVNTHTFTKVTSKSTKGFSRNYVERIK